MPGQAPFDIRRGGESEIALESREGVRAVWHPGVIAVEISDPDTITDREVRAIRDFMRAVHRTRTVLARDA